MDEAKAYYKCIRKELWFAGRTWGRNEVYYGITPADGKGNSLCEGTYPAFLPLGPSDPTLPPPQAVDMTPDYLKDDDSGAEDPRTKKEVMRDIERNFGEKVNPRLRKADILEKERILRMVARKDAATPMKTETDYNVI